MKQDRQVSLIIQFHYGGFLIDSDRSIRLLAEVPINRMHLHSPFLIQSKNLPVGVKQINSLVHFALSATPALLFGICLYGTSLSGWVIHEKQMGFATKWTTYAQTLQNIHLAS